jgi:SAM-dependent methyltransferase
MTAMYSDHAELAYDALAPAYDLLTATHDYEAWTATLEALAVEAGLTGRRLLDVACGTGKSFEPFLARGYEVCATDVSAEMLREARTRTRGEVRLERHDMRALPALGAFDLVTCLDDAVNYLHDEAELVALFGGIRANLAPGGLAVFDVNTLDTFRALYSSILVAPSPDRVVVMAGQSTPELPPGGLAEAHIDAYQRGDDGWWSRSRGVHRHRHHPDAVVRAALAGAGLECAAAHGMRRDGSVDGPPDDLRHSKALYIARVGAPDGGGGR